MVANNFFQLKTVDPSWQQCILDGLQQMNPSYLENLTKHHWLPGPEKIFNAFSQPVNNINYVLFGESPYPRAASANGFAFWDEAVTDLWSTSGLNKTVNRATSLRNILKMLLIAENALLPQNTSQEQIAQLNKQNYIQTNHELFSNLLQRGFLLLNASLVLQDKDIHPVKKDAIAWQPFLKHILIFLSKKRPNVQLILLGNIAAQIDKITIDLDVKKFYSEHPYNISFITNPTVIEFFKPLSLLRK